MGNFDTADVPFDGFDRLTAGKLRVVSPSNQKSARMDKIRVEFHLDRHS